MVHIATVVSESWQVSDLVGRGNLRQLIPWNGVKTAQICHLQSSKVWLGIPCDAKAAILDGHAGSSASGNDDRHVQGFLLPKSWSRKRLLRGDSHHDHHVQCDHVCVCGHVPLMPLRYLKEQCTPSWLVDDYR